MLLMFLALSLTTAVVPPSPAPPRPCPVDRVCAWDVASVVRGLQAAGYKAFVTKSDEGKPFIISATNGQNFAVDYYNCDDDVAKTGCRTLMFDSYFPPAPYLTIALANEFNKKAMYGRAHLGDEGRLEFQLPMATDGGMPQAQFKAMLDWYTAADGDLNALAAGAEAAATKQPAKKP